MLTHRRAASRWRTRFVFAAVAGSTLVLAQGCAPRRAEPPARPAEPAAPAAVIPQDARAFEVDPARSVVVILVRRAGPLAKLGHNHVITSGEEAGVVWEGREPEGSGFELSVPIRSLVVDDPVVRAEAGPDFAGEVPQAARDATYQNLLRPEVLDAARYPEIVVRSSSLGGSWSQPVATAEITLKGVTRTIEVPLELERSGPMLTARGTFRIRQTDHGLVPFSVAGGAIQVADEVDIRFEIVATAH